MEKYALHLDPEFRPYKNLRRITHESFTFPSGCEPHIKISEDSIVIINPEDTVVITHRIKNLNDFFLICFAADALQYRGINNLELLITYLPFARQDRRMDNGEPLSIKIISNMINQMNFKRVDIYDPHSEVATALINNSHSIYNHKFVKACLSDFEKYTLVCPDSGAYKKFHGLCQYLEYESESLLCTKIRDTTTGRIQRIDINYNTNQPETNCIIVDDICDGGGTFVLLAEKIKHIWPWAKIHLIISHGIFSNGFPLKGIDHIYTTNSIPNKIPNTGYVTQIKLENLLQ